MDKTTFGERINGLIELKGITKKEVSEKLMISPSTLTGYLKDDRTPDIETVKRMAAYFNTTCDYIIGYKEKRDANEGISADLSSLIQIYESLPEKGQEIVLEQSKAIYRIYNRDNEKK